MGSVRVSRVARRSDTANGVGINTLPNSLDRYIVSDIEVQSNEVGRVYLQVGSGGKIGQRRVMTMSWQRIDGLRQDNRASAEEAEKRAIVVEGCEGERRWEEGKETSGL
jgi:hypothetical protein